MSFRSVSSGLAAALGAVLLLSASLVHAEDKVVAKLNGQDITEADLTLAEGDIGEQLASLPAEAKRRVLVEYIIETRLFAAAAEAEKLASDPDFARRLAYWRDRAMRDAYFEKTIKGSLSEGLLRGIYDDKVKQLPPEEEVRARHILVDTEEEAKELAQKIAAGADFATLAKENSKDPGSKQNGGDLGYFGRGQMVGTFEVAAFALKPGEVSKPVKSQFGWHLIKVEDRRPRKPPSFEDVKAHIMTSMVQSKAQNIATDLRAKAAIEYIDPDVKKQVELDAAKAEAQQKLLEAQTKKLIEDSGEAAPPADDTTTPAPAP